MPVACGSITDLSFTFKNPLPVTAGKILHDKAQALGGIIDFCTDCTVSTDVIGNPASAVIGGLKISENNREANIMAFYDNEWGYANRLLDLALYIAGKS